MKQSNLQIEYIKTDDLIPYVKNPKKHPKEQINLIASSIKEFGFLNPIIIDKDNEIIAGHGRLLASKKIGLEYVPVIRAEHLTPAQVKAYRIADNKLTELGEWDEELLKIELEELKEIEFNLNLTGFDDDEIEKLLEEYDETEQEVEDDKYEGPEELITDIKRGDLFKLGEHYLMCGDSSNIEDVKKLMQGHKVDVIFCDPPYNIGLDYTKGISTEGKYSKTEYAFKDDNKSIEEYKEFLAKTIENALKVAKEDVHIFYWCDQNYIGLLQEIYREKGIKPQRVALWIKNNITPTPQVAFNKCYEPCVYGVKGKPKLNKKIKNLNEILNKEITSKELIQNLLAVIDIWLAKRENVLEYEHPTQKPVVLYEKPLKRVSEEGDIVLDLFGGSGTTLIACEQLNRKAFLMEQDPYYCQVIIDRWERLTGKTAEKVEV